VFLLSMQNAFAVANLTLSAEFRPVETGRTHMDVGGTWDGSANAAGDVFRFTVANAGPDSAFDLKDIIVDVPSGFVVGQASVSVSDSPASCNNINGITAALTAPTEVTFGISPDTDIDAGCSYDFDLVLSTNSSVVPANYTVTFNSSYNENSDGSGIEQNFFATTPLFAVNAGGISLSKTTAEANPPDNTIVSFNVAIQNTGSGGLFDVRLSDVLGAGLINLNIIPPASPTGSFSGSDYIFDYVPGGGTTVNVTVEARTDIDPASSTCPTLTNTASVVDRTNIIVPDSSASIPFNLAALSVSHVSTSRCVLCGTGTVTLRLTNSSAVDINTVEIREDLLASELRIINGTSRFNSFLIADPVRSPTPAVLNEYTWTTTQTVPANSSRDLTFDVVYDTASFGINEDLARNNTTIAAEVDYELSCGTAQPTISSGNYLLTLDQPLPQVSKLARNVDAGQTGYTATVYGHEDDDVIWRVRVNNTGPINMQDVVLDDSITGNFDIDYVCPSEFDANNAATGGALGGCVSAGGGVTTAVNNFLMNDPFGVAGADDVNASTFEDIFYVGKIRASCGLATNTVNVEWGCDVDGTVGGLSSTDIFSGGTVDTATATLSSQGNGALSASSITHTITGVDGGAEVGSRGIVTIRVENDTGGTIRGVVIDDVLPAEYVVDTTAPIDFVFAPAYGNTYG
ncbi:MAG: hypothetical protein KJO91_06425, partial [Gammaproteobacteria bacterium]|nr:hypothetical protein [Gammaproteobacteria bacterium]